MKILVLNSGSSSQKAALYEIGKTMPEHPPRKHWEGCIEWNGITATTVVKNRHGVVEQHRVTSSSREELVNSLVSSLWNGAARIVNSPSEIDAVGHRIVHGGPQFEEPVFLTPEVRSAISGVADFAPLHIPSELEGMAIIDNLMGRVPQMAVFDTGFHRQMPLQAAIYPGPYEWFERGIRRYGFHGINHQYCARRTAQLLGRNPQSLRLVSCHLGNGCSVAAIHDGRSVDTTMGFTPLDGLMMGTRSGAVDPGILTFLMRGEHLDGDGIDRILNHQSGLLGVSGFSSDMRDILKAMRHGHSRAKLAFEIYIHRLRNAIGAMAAVLGGMDALVFTAGIGEHSPEVRAAACENLDFLGVKLDEGANSHPTPDQDISSPESNVHVIVIRAEEDWAIAVECWRLTHLSKN
jgi:acetate kinase